MSEENRDDTSILKHIRKAESMCRGNGVNLNPGEIVGKNAIPGCSPETPPPLNTSLERSVADPGKVGKVQ